MPTQGPARRSNATATKAVLHGDPTVENNIPGVAFKSTQTLPYADPTQAAYRTVAIGEDFVVEVGGMVEARTAAFVGASLPTKGQKLYIVAGTNLLTTVATGNVKFGVVEEVLTARGLAKINADARDTF